MLYNIFYDVAAFVIFALLIFSAVYREMIYGLANRVFLGILNLALVSTLLDALLALKNMPELIAYTLNNIHLTVMAAMLPTYVLLVMAQARLRERMNPSMQAFFCAPYAVFVITVWLINPLLQWSYESVDRHFMGGILGGVLFAMAMLYLIMAVYVLIQNYKNVEKNAFFNIILAIPLIFLSIWVERIFPDHALMAFVFAINAMIYAESVQRPEAVLDIETGLSKLDVFMREMKITLLSRQKVSVFILKIENYNRLAAMMGTEVAMKLKRTIADGMRDTLKATGGLIDIYYLDYGMFAFTLSESRREKLEFLIDNSEKCIYDRLEKVQRLTSAPAFYTCVLNLPEDIGDYHAIMPFLRAFEEILPRAGKVYRMSELKERGNAGLYMNIGNILQRALSKNEVSVYFTPIYSEAKHRIAGAEAENMLIDPRYGAISPRLCMITAENTGCADKLMQVTFDGVCRFIASASFKEAGLEFVTMKLSVKSLMDQYLCDSLLRQIKRYGIEPENIVFEITETAEVEDWNELLAQVQLLRFSGFGISLNDYGQSNSNIKRLLAFPLTHIKIDGGLMRSVEREVPLSSSDGTNFLSPWEVIMHSTVDMMCQLRLRVIADGVDDVQSVLHATEMGCEYMQGTNFGVPMAPNAFFRKIEETEANIGLFTETSPEIRDEYQIL